MRWLNQHIAKLYIGCISYFFHAAGNVVEFEWMWETQSRKVSERDTCVIHHFIYLLEHK